MTSNPEPSDDVGAHIAGMPAFSIADAAPIEDHIAGGRLTFPTVALGASAGGIDALQRFLRVMPVDSHCAFVIVMHLDPGRESILASLLARATDMSVVQAANGMMVEENHVYVIPPGAYLEISAGRLLTSPMGARSPRPKAVDLFMMSLAADQREQAIGIVLTGADGDGSLGVKAIKAEGGMTIAQTPESAEHVGMPESAIQTGMIDACLPIEQMPAAILAYVTHAHLHGPRAAGSGDPQNLSALPDVLTELKKQTGLDFGGYKSPMLLRRIHRRMGLARIGEMQQYLVHLRDNAGEAAALSEDFLISVTQFFREPDAWAQLADEIVPRLLAGKGADDTLRIWVPACATGEEAYSLAMLLLEHPDTAKLRLKVQIFATDVDRSALEIARVGRYPLSIDSPVSAKRRQRFFTAGQGHYQVTKELRETVLFAPHNLIADPPFSHMQMVSCRNLLIYLDSEMQQRLLQVFHFALERDGYLFLGKSESAASQPELFVSATPHARIYRRVGQARVPQGLNFPPTPARARAGLAYKPHRPPRDSGYATMVREALLNHIGTAGILTSHGGLAQYFYGPVRDYVVQPEGAPTSDLYTLLREDMRPHARALIHKALRAHERVEATVAMHVPDGAEVNVRMAAIPMPSHDDPDLLLLSFERLAPGPQAGTVPRVDDSVALRALEDELHGTKGELRSVIEELESTNEELKVAHEEAMSTNEELQSTNEELETSKEELQALNEELVTVNNQLQDKVRELEGLNNDLGNLLTSTNTPTLFLDRQMRIKRFTPAATTLFSLLPGDIDRPLADIASRCDMQALHHDAGQVLSELTAIETETVASDGRCYLRRTTPYRTHDNRIDGIVITFVDVSDVKRAAEELRRLGEVVRSSSDAIIVHDGDFKVLAWNRGAQALYGYTEAQTLGTTLLSLLPKDARESYRQQVREALDGDLVQDVVMKRRTRDGRAVDVSSTLSVVPAEAGQATVFALIERDITDRVRADSELRASEQRFRSLANHVPALIWICDADGRLTFTNRECTVATGWPADALRGRRWSELLDPDDAARARMAARPVPDTQTDTRVAATARLLAQDGSRRWVKLVTLPLTDATGDKLSSGLVGCMFDIDAQVRGEEALRMADRRKDEFLAMLGHELRNPLVPIRNAAEVLQTVARDDPRLTWVRGTLVRQVEHVTRLVDDLLDISRVSRGTMHLHREPVQLGEVVAAAVESTRALLTRRKHRFKLQLPDQVLWVEGDKIRLTQIVENLLTNAAKYTDEGGEVSLQLSVDAGDAVLQIHDDGIGIDPGMRGRVFDLFVQDERALDRSEGGLGIGLALVRHLVNLHRGSITAESMGQGKGSQFEVRLPLLPDAIVPAPLSAPAADAASGGRVLLIDDDVDVIDSLAVLLGIYGFNVETARDVESALRVAAAFVPQVVLLDLAMPEADGYEVARRLRALPGLAKTQYIAISGFGSAEHLAASRRHGFAHHFVKPADPEEIRALLTELIDAQNDAAAPR